MRNKNQSSGFKNPFSSGLGRNGKIAAWGVAIIAVAGYQYYEGQSTRSTFTREEMQNWNENKKDVKENK